MGNPHYGYQHERYVKDEPPAPAPAAVVPSDGGNLDPETRRLLTRFSELCDAQPDADTSTILRQLFPRQ